MATKQFTTQGSVKITRLRNGVTLFLSIENLGGPLFQGVDITTTPVSVVPDWTVEANRPILKPKCIASTGGVVGLSNHQWSWNGTLLVFSGDVDDQGYQQSTNGKFAMKSDGTLKIIANLADAVNYAADVLKYSATATYNGYEYHQEKVIDIDITKLGSTPYRGTLKANPQMLDDQNVQTTIQSWLYHGTSPFNDYTINWYNGYIGGTLLGTGKTLTLTRDQVNGSMLVVAQFMVSGNPEYVHAIRISDKADRFEIKYYMGGSGVVDDGVSETVTAYICRLKDSQDVTAQCQNIVWDLNVVDYQDGTTIRSLGTSNQTTITTADTDRTGEYHDVTVVGEVQFEYDPT